MSTPTFPTATLPDLTALTDAQLDDLAAALAAERDRRKAAAGSVPVSLATVRQYDSRKHGHAYVAVLSLDGAKVERDFIDGGTRQWDSKRKYYYREWEFEAPAGSVLECRLNDGSWKNDYREWYEVTTDGLRRLSQSEAVTLLKERRDA